MKPDLMDLYRRGSEWTGDKVAGVKDLEGRRPARNGRSATCSTTCSTRNVTSQARDAGRARRLPARIRRNAVSGTPANDFAQARSAVISVFSQEGVTDKTMPALGVAFTDALIHR